MLKSFLRDQRGESGAEYALIVAVVSVGLGAAALALGANVTFSVDKAASEIVADDPAPGEGS
jgi:pilus assembly protein Flp/PilA